MAKALLGHLGGVDPRHAGETVGLRRRVADLETLVARLQHDNDELSAALRERDLELAARLDRTVDGLDPADAARLLEPALH